MAGTSLSAWGASCATLHRWTQVVGKIQLALTPLVNHWWNVTLLTTARGPRHTAAALRRGHFYDRLRFHRASPEHHQQPWS